MRLKRRAKDCTADAVIRERLEPWGCAVARP
jgi:hypothetical protein